MTKAPVHMDVAWDSPLKAKIRKAVLSAGLRAGLRIEKVEDDATYAAGPAASTVDLQHKVAATPGMITLRRAMYLYWLAYSATSEGDVIEIGSWQGRSTIALAQGCADSGAGVVHAIDTFKGNPGHEDSYIIGKPDLSDLEQNFRDNIAKAGLTDHVVTYPKSSDDALPEIKAVIGDGARMMYIDGEHTYDAVRAELSAYGPLLAPGGVLTFDDYSAGFEGVVQAVNEYLAENKTEFATPVQDLNFLVVRRRR